MIQLNFICNKSETELKVKHRAKFFQNIDIQGTWEAQVVKWILLSGESAFPVPLLLPPRMLTLSLSNKQIKSFKKILIFNRFQAWWI